MGLWRAIQVGIEPVWQLGHQQLTEHGQELARMEQRWRSWRHSRGLERVPCLRFGHDRLAEWINDIKVGPRHVLPLGSTHVVAGAVIDWHTLFF